MRTSLMLLLMALLAAGGIILLGGEATGMVTGGSICADCDSLATMVPILVIGLLLFSVTMMISWKTIKA